MPFKSSGGGFEKLKKALEIAKYQGKTGWPSSATYEKGQRVVDVAEYNEYGHKRKNKPPVPPRPFMRNAINKNEHKWMQFFGQSIQECLHGNISPTTVLEETAKTASDDVAQSIKDFTAPALDEKTIKRKGFDKPLVDTGLMFQTVTGIVEPKE